eukprot:CAMPEP_0194443454 /NCGR_PEP_ID=MMETSP0176-20130528/126715_1 /TAXON_ID=216777 /ORGANISM="Proboscia alata, Strain PI-D3" /LENGTH=171 /DNA_ID=CAMNT_0039269705 /DNA_START=122 /DNA_END=636 /DNA_ORIENTATION=+
MNTNAFTLTPDVALRVRSEIRLYQQDNLSNRSTIAKGSALHVSISPFDTGLDEVRSNNRDHESVETIENIYLPRSIVDKKKVAAKSLDEVRSNNRDHESVETIENIYLPRSIVDKKKKNFKVYPKEKSFGARAEDVIGRIAMVAVSMMIMIESSTGESTINNVSVLISKLN